MRRLDRYIVEHVLALTAIVALALIAIQGFLAFVADLDDAGNGNFSYSLLMLYTVLKIPRALYLLLPVVAMVGTLMGLGVLASQSELTAMRAAGVSVTRIGGSTAMAGGVVAALCLLLGDWIAPAGYQYAEVMRTEAMYGPSAGESGRPIWLRQGTHVLHIRQLLAEDHIGQTDIFTLDGAQRLRAAASIREAFYEDGHWRLVDVQRTEFLGDSARAQQWPEQIWEGELSPDVLRLFLLEAKALSIHGLWTLINYLDENHLDASAQRLALWRKIVAPVTIVALMLFTVPFVFGSLRSVGAGQRLLVGILIGLGFYVLNDIVANTGQLYGWSPWMSAGVPTAVLLSFSFWRLRRVS